MKKVYFLLWAVLASVITHAQLLIWTPAFAKDNDNITITVDATKGNQGLQGFSGNVYVHVGVITSLSTSSSNWLYVPFAWGTANAAAQATPAGTNKWSYTITNIRSFFGVPAAETIKKIAILFRDAGGNTVQRNSDGSDMYIPIYDNSIAVRFALPPTEPRYIPVPEPITVTTGQSISLTGIANQVSDMKLYLNGTVIQTLTGVTLISAAPTLTTSGNNEIVVEGTASSVTKKDTLRFFVSPGVNIAPLPNGVRNGINYAANNTDVTLVLYAPGKNRVSVIGEFAGSNWIEQTQYVMNKTPDGNYWWLTITGLTPGTEYAYQYLVDGSLKIADPYTEKILDPNNDQYISSATYPGLKPYPAGQTGIVSLLQTAAPQYNWQVNNFTRPDKRNLFIYELLVRDFVAAHDWKTLKDTISYLKRLGINAIELMPLNEFEGNDSWGYNPDFYFAPDKYYGPKNNLKEFIDICHSNGIAVVMDIALNHSFGSSPLVQLYWDAANNRPAANNPWFNPVAKHAFNVGFDMNHESPATHYYFSRVVENWLQQYRIDGFRFDLSKGFTQTQTCDNNGGNCNVGAWGAYDASRVAIWKGYYDTLQLKSPGSYAILEHFADNTEELELSNYGMMPWGNMAYNFEQASMGINTGWNFEGGIYSVRGWSKPYLVTYMESHDEERMAYKNINFGNSSGSYNTKDTSTSLTRLEISAAFLMSMPGPKMIWQFGELGYDYTINYCVNGTINNSCRLDDKPIRWDYPQQVRRQRLYDIYSSLSKLRYHGWYQDIFTANNITLTRDLSGAVKWMTIRSATDSSELVIVGNFDVATQPGSITFPTAGTWYDYLRGTTFTATGTSQSISLLPGEYHLYLNRNLVNAVTTPVIDINNPGNALQLNFYPNPAESNSVAEVYMPEKGNLQVGLWNMEGQKVATVFSGTLAKGKHSLPLPAETNKLPGGIYLLQAQVKSKTLSAKILIK
ncbi:MAG: alpha-amylase family glycosyl hydrolase [Bacteroidota bacterium]|nr:alpha-amylase family glycosyl hydrolase [Bacteroidota bacterium]